PPPLASLPPRRSSDLADEDTRARADDFAEPAERQRRGKTDELHQQERCDQATLLQTKREAVVHGHLDDRVDAVDVEPVRNQEVRSEEHTSELQSRENL